MKLFQKPILAMVLLFATAPAFACITCDRRIREGIFDSAFGKNVLVMVLPFAVLGGIEAKPTPVPLLSASLVLGIGFGGFIDGILFHQILQWHEMISARMPPVNYVAKSVNMFWDGIFHAVTLLVTLVGVILLWKLLRRRDIDCSGNLLAAGLIGGWGLFNIVEGVFDHHLLKLHNVREVTPNHAAWNYGLLIFSVVLLLIGFMLARGKRVHA